MARHAFASEDKLARRNVILDAARSLFVGGDGSLPSAAHIADAADLAKGTVYLYFRTKEEIFAALLLGGWLAVMDEVGTTFATSDGGPELKVGAFLANYAAHLDGHPELMRLDALGYGVLERNMGAGSLRAFKLTLAGRLTEVGAVIDAALGLTEGRGFRLLMRTYAFTRGLWQSTQGHGPSAPEIEPALARLYPDFGDELREGLAEYWRGALMSVLAGRPVRSEGKRAS